MSQARLQLTLVGAIFLILMMGIAVYVFFAWLTYIFIGCAVLALLVGGVSFHRSHQLARLPLKAHELEAQRLEHEQEMERERLELDREKHLHDIQLAQERHTQELQMGQRRFELEQHVLLTRVLPDTNGHYPYVVTEQGQYQHLPNPYHTTRQITATTVSEARTSAAPPLVAPGMQQPTQRSLIDQLEVNGLQVSPGIRASDGQPVILSIPDAVHFKLIGSSGFGKSCLAAAILEQAIRLNSPDFLQVALLDLEHKTSRLFEHAPNVATLQVGRRSVPMVATSADEVALHLGYLKKELDRRALLSEYDLQGEPLMLIYVEEMLSLQFEVDEELIGQMLKDLSVLAVRARKYNMFLLACAQTDYSTPELKTAQKQFRSRMAFAIDATAARAAGFMSTELIKYSFSHSQRGDGLYVLETPGVASLMLAPVYDVRAKVLSMDARSGNSTRVQHEFNGSSTEVHSRFKSEPLHIVNAGYTSVHEVQDSSELSKKAQVEQLLKKGWGKMNIIEKLWNVKRGGSLGWKKAVAEYNSIMTAASVVAEGREA